MSSAFFQLKIYMVPFDGFRESRRLIKIHWWPNTSLAATAYKRLFYSSSTVYFPNSPGYLQNTKNHLLPRHERKREVKESCVFCATSKTTQNSCRLLRCADELCLQSQETTSIWFFACSVQKRRDKTAGCLRSSPAPKPLNYPSWVRDIERLLNLKASAHMWMKSTKDRHIKASRSCLRLLLFFSTPENLVFIFLYKNPPLSRKWSESERVSKNYERRWNVRRTASHFLSYERASSLSLLFSMMMMMIIIITHTLFYSALSSPIAAICHSIDLRTWTWVHALYSGGTSTTLGWAGRRLGRCRVDEDRSHGSYVCQTFSTPIAMRSTVSLSCSRGRPWKVSPSLCPEVLSRIASSQ